MNRHFHLIARMLAVVAAIVIPFTMKSKNTPPGAPDFAYPEKVATNAVSQLDKALKEADGQSVVNALIKYGLAKTSISADNYAEVINKVESVIDKESQPAVKSLLQILLADIYNSYYASNRYNFDERTTVDGENDFTLWSGAQFKDKIRGLYVDALSRQKELLEAQTADYPEIINSGDYTYTFYTTLFDFASNKAINVLNSLTERQVVFPINALFNKVAIPRILTPANRTIVDIADNWVAAHSSESAPYIQALIARSDYLSRCVVNDKPNNQSVATLALAAYRNNLSNPYAIEILIDVDSYLWTGETATEAYEIFSDFITSHSDYIRIEAVKAAKDIIAETRVIVSAPALVVKNRPTKISVTLQNTPEATVNFYRLKSGISKTDNFKINDFETTPCHSTTVKSDKAIPFTDTVQAEFTLPVYGVYRIAIEGEKNNYNYVETIRCSDIALISNSLCDDIVVWAVNPATGKPIPGVNIKLKEIKGSNTQPKTETTDSEGAVVVHNSAPSFKITAFKGADKYALPIWVYPYEFEDTRIKAVYLNT
ncbi:MAG: hypothetical protein K2N91_01980, partial [Muribaculaceae bacterium]|nr:hypothetical protein [Muribaculaceae bacterium]